MINHLTSFAGRLTSVVGSAIILLFFSEFYFLNEGPVQTIIDTWANDPTTKVLALAEFVLFYSLFAYIFWFFRTSRGEHVSSEILSEVC